MKRRPSLAPMRRLFGEIADDGLTGTLPAGTSYPQSGTAPSARNTCYRRPHGCSGTTLLGHGFRVGMLADLVGDGLATARRETLRVGKRKITVARIRITDAGRQAIEG